MSERQTIAITGATDGLGKGLATELAPRGARLILHGRNEEKGQARIEELGPKASGELVWRLADLSSLDEVRNLAEALLEEDRIDVLVNNAGIGTAGRAQEALRRHELTFAVFSRSVSMTRHLPLIQRSADRQRQLGRPGFDRLRRRDAGAQLQRHPGHCRNSSPW